MTFILKEIYEFSTAKLTDGTNLFDLRKVKNEIKELNKIAKNLSA